MSDSETDRNLLFGVLALQADLIDAARFAEACTAWAARKEAPLADLLVERGWITAEDRAHVERLLRRKLKKHGGDARAEPRRRRRRRGPRRPRPDVDDPEVRQSLGRADGAVGGTSSISTVAPPARRRASATP